MPEMNSVCCSFPARCPCFHCELCTNLLRTAKSKKQRRIAAKSQKALEAKLLAEGNLEALAPKIPLPQQSINLPGKEGSSVEENIAAAKKREELRKAMRKERKAKIKEANYLKSM